MTFCFYSCSCAWRRTFLAVVEAQDDLNLDCIIDTQPDSQDKE